MIRVVKPYQPPAAPPATGNFRTDAEKLRTYITRDLEPYNFNYINELTTSFNNGSQGEGLPLTISGGTLMPTSFIHHVTNNATVTTITVPANFPFAGQLTLIADAGLTLQTGGNIATTRALSVGAIATLTYSIQAGKWYTIAVANSLGDITDFAAWQATTAYLMSDSIIDANGNLQAVTTPGTSGATIPVFNLTVGGTTADGATLVWTNQGAPPISPTRYTVRAIDVNHRPIVDMSQAHPNKTLDAVPDGATRFAAVAAGGAASQTTINPPFNFAYAEIPPGGGSAATLSTIGGTGPTVATQDGWLKVRILTVNVWIPVWR